MKLIKCFEFGKKSINLFKVEKLHDKQLLINQQCGTEKIKPKKYPFLILNYFFHPLDEVKRCTLIFLSDGSMSS